MLLAAVPCPLPMPVKAALARGGVQTLVFLRHGRSPRWSRQLIARVQPRHDLSRLPEKFGKADYVFAANPTRNVEEGELDNSYSYIRPLMTISPAAIKLGLPVNIEFSANDTSDLARELLDDKYHNSTIYTAWSHGYLPELINKVAGNAVGEKQSITDDWSGGDYDTLYVRTLTWHERQGVVAEPQLQQGLNNGEETCRKPTQVSADS